MIPSDTDKNPSTPKENHQKFSRALWVHLVKDATIYSSTSAKSHFKLITYINIDNRFDLIFAVVFAISPQLGVLVSKAQELVI